MATATTSTAAPISEPTRTRFKSTQPRKLIMLTVSQLAEELNRSRQVIFFHVKKLGVGTLHPQFNVITFTKSEADKIRSSVKTAKAGWKKGVKRKPAEDV